MDVKQTLRDWAPVVLQLVGAVLLAVGFGIWLGAAAVWISAGIILLMVGVLLGFSTVDGEVTDDAERTGETG